MSLVDRFLARRSVMFTSPLSVSECRDRIGRNSNYSLVGSGANGTSPFIVKWRSDTSVTLTKPWLKWSRRRYMNGSLQVRFDPQSDGTFVDAAMGVPPLQVLNYALIWLFFAGFALLNLGSLLHEPGPKMLLAFGFSLLIGPALYLGARTTIARQGPDLVSTLEGVLAAVTSPAP